MKQGDMEVLAKAFAPVIREMVIRAMKPVVERLRYLELREPSQGEPGAPGRDGLGFDDMDVCVLDDDRTIELSFRRGEEEKAFTFKWPTTIYRDVYKEGEQYEPGDMVTWGGSLWHCDQSTKEKPGTDAWTLAVKRGRDGKDAKPNG